jgi:hypothetical protein
MQRGDGDASREPEQSKIEDANRAEQHRHAREVKRLEDRPPPLRRPQELALRRVSQVGLNRVKYLV